MQLVPQRLEVDDPRQLLPHFTVALWCQLVRRLRERIHENLMENRGSCMALNAAQQYKTLPNEIVARMYHNQLAAAYGIMSFSEAMIQFNQPRMDAANQRAEIILGAKINKLTTMFQPNKKSLA